MSKEPTNKDYKIAIWVLIIGAILVIGLPLILSLKAGVFIFSQTSALIGDTLGGITSPITNLIGAVLVYLALKAQINANNIIQKQINEQDRKELQRETSEQLHRLYKTMEENIKNYSFKGFYNDEPEYKGSQAIHRFLSSIRCEHQQEDTLLEMPSVTEFFSIIQLCNLILQKLNETDIPDKELLQILTKHLFEYRINPALKNYTDEELKIYYCSDCKCMHGIPTILLQEITEIKNQLNSIEKVANKSQV